MLTQFLLQNPNLYFAPNVECENLISGKIKTKFVVFFNLFLTKQTMIKTWSFFTFNPHSNKFEGESSNLANSEVKKNPFLFSAEEIKNSQVLSDFHSKDKVNNIYHPAREISFLSEQMLENYFRYCLLFIQTQIQFRLQDRMAKAVSKKYRARLISMNGEVWEKFKHHQLSQYTSSVKKQYGGRIPNRGKWLYVKKESICFVNGVPKLHDDHWNFVRWSDMGEKRAILFKVEYVYNPFSCFLSCNFQYHSEKYNTDRRAWILCN